MIELKRHPIQGIEDIGRSTGWGSAVENLGPRAAGYAAAAFITANAAPDLELGRPDRGRILPLLYELVEQQPPLEERAMDEFMGGAALGLTGLELSEVRQEVA